MFEREIRETIQRITREVLRDSTLIPLKEILEDRRIPNRLKGFFENEAHWWIYTESVARTRDRRFDYSDPELASLLNYLEGVQARHARFEREEFLSTLESGVKLTYNYICRPQTTLKWFVFRGEPTKGLGETLLRMNAFVDYPYFVTVFNEWIERKRTERPTFDSISSREFERIIRRIDDQILLSCTIDELLEIMDPLFSFIGEGEEQRVPVEALIVYFDDKNIQRLVDFLDEIAAHHEYITRESFAHLIEELLVRAEGEPEADFSSVYQDDVLDDVVRHHLGDSADVSPPSTENVVEREAAVDPREYPPENRPERKPERDDEPDSESRRDREDESEEEKEAEKEVEKEVEITNDEPDADAPVFIPQGRSPGRPTNKEETPDEPGSESDDESDIRAQIDQTLEKKVIKKIFGRDRKKYELFLDQVNGADSWRKASNLLDRLFLDNEVDPYSRTAIRFTDKVYGRFIN